MVSTELPKRRHCDPERSAGVGTLGQVIKLWMDDDDGPAELLIVEPDRSTPTTADQPVRSAYQPPVSNTFFSEQTSRQQSVSSTFLSEQTNTSHQPPVKRTR
jgi:hypothetical protein